MADNDNNDEYKFAELDSMENESMSEGTPGSNNALGYDPDSLQRKNVKRNALIVIGVVLLAMVLYKLAGAVFTEKNSKDVSKNSIPSIATLTPQPVLVQPVISSTPPPPAVIAPVQPVIMGSDNELKQKVSAIDQSQQNVTAEVNSLGQQVSAVNNSMNNLNTQISNLNQVITNLSNQVVKQSEEISVLMTRSEPKRPKIVLHRVHTRPVVYHIQAVIPGRAWLIGTNGSTLTVREGTVVAGYGTVKLIDAMQGRIVTSSGHIIRFSQKDS